MSAAEALLAAEAVGVRVAVDGADLVLVAAAPPPADILDQLARFKHDILRLLRPRPEAWSAEDWQAFFHERAGIAEFDEGLSRPEAERLALAQCADEWERRTLRTGPTHLCSHCRAARHGGAAVILLGSGGGRGWLHPVCWAGWKRIRRAEAHSALAAMGLPCPDALPSTPADPGPAEPRSLRDGPANREEVR